MRKEVSVTIEGKEIKVFELRNKELMVLAEKYGDLLQAGITIKDLPKIAKDIVPTCTSLTLTEFEEMPARLTMPIYKAFESINTDFFQILEPKKVEVVNPATESKTA